jgi:hypothetical protein
MIRKLSVHIDAEILDGKNTSVAHIDCHTDTQIQPSEIPEAVAGLLRAELGAWVHSATYQKQIDELSAKLAKVNEALMESRTKLDQAKVIPVVENKTVAADAPKETTAKHRRRE